MRALKNGIVNTSARDAIAATYRRIARVTNVLIADLPPEALSTLTFGLPEGSPAPTLNETLTAADILENRQPQGHERWYADPHWVLESVHPEHWYGRTPTPDTALRTAESEQAIPATARQALAAAASFGAALMNFRRAGQSNRSPEERERYARRAPGRLADANAILDVLEPELGLAQAAGTAPENLPDVDDLAALPSIARAIAAIRARDAADQDRTVYADVLGTALEELKQEHGRGWTILAANALAATPSSVDEALRRYQRRRASRESPPE